MSETGSTAVLDDYRIKICCPVYSESCHEHMLSLIESEVAGIRFDYQLCQSAMLALSRNTLVSGGSTLIRQSLTQDYTHYLFIDGDIGWHPGAITSLLARKKDIVSACYKARSDVKCYQAGRWGVAPGDPGPLVSMQSKGLNLVDWVGAGFVLVTREALERMPYPWFRHVMVDYDEDIGNGAVKRHAIESNEDAGFCVNAANSGIQVYLDCEVRVNHVVDFDTPPLRVTRPMSHFEVGGDGMKVNVFGVSGIQQ